MTRFHRFALFLTLFVAVCGGVARAAGTTPQTHDENLRAGNESYAKGEIDKALDYFAAAVKMRDDSSVANLMHGSVLMDKRDYAGAVKDFTKSIELNKYEFIAHRRRAEAYEKLGRAADAATDKQLAKQREAELAAPRTAEEWYKRAIYLQERSELMDAIDAFDTTLKLDPKYRTDVLWDNIHEQRGDLLAVTFEPGQAAEDYTKALLANPKSVELLLKRARALSLCASMDTQDVKSIGLAAADYSAIIARAPELQRIPEWLVEAYTSRADILIDKRDYAAALPDLNAALALETDNVQARVSRAYANRRLGKADEAFTDVNAVIAKDPSVVNAWVERAGLHADKRDYVKALADYDRAIALAPNDAYLRTDRGVAFFNKGDIEKALVDFSAAILLNPKLASAWNNRGSAYARKGEWATAIADYNKALELNPAHRGAYLNRAIAYRKTNKPDLAAADKAKAKELEKPAP